jgi:hypothetical protein
MMSHMSHMNHKSHTHDDVSFWTNVYVLACPYACGVYGSASQKRVGVCSVMTRHDDVSSGHDPLHFDVDVIVSESESERASASVSASASASSGLSVSVSSAPCF